MGRVNSRVGRPSSDVVLVYPNGLFRGRHPELIEGERLIVRILEPVHFAIAGRCHIPGSNLQRFLTNVEHATSFGHEPDMTGADVVMGGGGVPGPVGDVVGFEVGKPEQLFSDQIDTVTSVSGRLKCGKVGAPHDVWHAATIPHRGVAGLIVVGVGDSRSRRPVGQLSPLRLAESCSVLRDAMGCQWSIRDWKPCAVAGVDAQTLSICLADLAALADQTREGQI